MPESLSYGPSDPARDVPAMGRIMGHAFAFSPDDFPAWHEKAGPANFRVLRDGGGSGAILGNLLLIPMGQFFGGRSVPMTGIAAVGVAPEARGRGVATVMMREAMKEIRASGIALSTLYPATQPLYRRVGYEQAGHRFEIRIPIVRLQADGVWGSRPGCQAGGTPAPQDLTVRAFTPADLDAVKALYREVGAEHDGHLDRGPYIWGRIQNPRQGPASGFIIEHGASRKLEGFVFLRQDRQTPTSARHDVHISDWCAVTERAGRRLLAFAAEFGSMGEDLVCHSGPSLPLFMLLREQRLASSKRDYWMVRITDLAAAVRARGHPRGLRTEVHLHVTDDTLPENAGPWTLRVENGSATCERGGRGDIRLDAGALASWYAGYLTLPVLRRLGRVQADDETLASAAGLFAGGTPSMPDMF